MRAVYFAIAAVTLICVGCSKENASKGSSAKTKVPEAVDLGIIVDGRNVKWASFNLGASAPHEYGDYYAWGEIESKANYSWETYAFSAGAYNRLIKYCPKGKKDYWDYAKKPEGPDGVSCLYPADDAAHMILGGKWRMPTNAEWIALRANCTWTWMKDYNGTGVAGRIGTSTVEGYRNKSIFLPAAGRMDGTAFNDAGSIGYYWSSDLNTDEPEYAWRGCLNYGAVYGGSSDRFYGQSVRAVAE